jgi:hypothetical protein
MRGMEVVPRWARERKELHPKPTILLSSGGGKEILRMGADSLHSPSSRRVAAALETGYNQDMVVVANQTPVDGFSLAAIAFMVLFLLVAPFLILLDFRERRRKAESRLRRWAAENGYRIIERSYKGFGEYRGPFFWSNRDLAVFWVIIEDRDGRARGGWVRFGSWWRGLDSEEVAVIWDNAG